MISLTLKSFWLMEAVLQRRVHYIKAITRKLLVHDPSISVHLHIENTTPGPNKIYVHNPKLAKVMGPLGAYFRTGYSLSEREREIAVCIITSKFHSAYPTNAHERAGKAAGLPPDKVEAILSGLPTSFSDAREQVVYEMATCLANARWVSKGLYDRAVAALGHVGITDVITLMGFYTSVAMTLAFYDVPADAPGMER
jgi:4-carboxymuconolactone decarboxylase